MKLNVKLDFNDEQDNAITMMKISHHGKTKYDLVFRQKDKTEIHISLSPEQLIALKQRIDVQIK